MTAQDTAAPAGKDALLALLQAKRLPEAKALGEALIREQPQDAEAWQLLGVIQGSLGEIQAAEACFRRAIALRPDYLKAHRNLVVALSNQGRTKDVIASLRTVIRLAPDDVGAHYSLGNFLYDEGDREGAEAAYREVVRLKPDHVEAHNNLGAIYTDQGRLDDAMACYRQALTLKPDHVEAHYNLGVAYFARGKFEEAIETYKQALQLKPDYLEARLNLGLALRALGQVDKAIQNFEEALRIKPDCAEAHFNLGNILLDQNKLMEAEACYESAVRFKADYPEAWLNLGLTLTRQENRPRAIQCLQEAVRLKPDSAEAYIGLGNVYADKEQHEEAIACFKEALRLKPDSAEAHNNLGNVYVDQDRHDEAIACYQEALRLKPDDVDVYNNLGCSYDTKAPFEAMEWLKKGLDLDPDNVSMLENLANIQRNQGMLDDALANLKKVLSIESDRSSAVYGLIATMNYHPRFSPEEIFAEYLRWGRMQAPSHTELLPPENVSDPDRKLRIGYVSPDFRTHSVAYFIVPVLASHDRARTEIFCYSDVPEPKHDDITRYLKGLDLHWRDSCGKSDLEIAREIRQDRIDILVDLAGHTAKNRLGVFAYRVAPVQITYLGHPNTTGLPAMDYRLTDEIADPPGQEAYYTEELVRLPFGFLCYSPIREPPGVASLPAPERGFVTFGSFNVSAKVTPQVIALWARILDAVPNSRILLKNQSLRHPPARERYHVQFEEHGIARDRVELVGWVSSREEHLRLYDRVDIGLDTFPYNGTTTTLEALSMGVPVLTLSGNRHAARVGASILSRLGLERFIAVGEDDYAARAVQLASELDHLARIRAGLRDTLTRSVLCDGKRFTEILEEAYRALWRRWCVAR